MSPGARLNAVLEELRTSYWFVPSVMSVCAVVAAVLCLKADQAGSYHSLQESGLVFGGGAEGARAVLSAIATSVITVAGTTFSVTIAALSFASAQFGPRLLRSFMRDRGNQFVLGAFTATFLYCLLVLRTVRGADESAMVPHLSVTVGVGLAVFSLAVLIYFIHHAAASIQLAHVLEAVGAELDDSIRRLFPARVGRPSPSAPEDTLRGRPVRAVSSGYVETIESKALLKLAADCDTTLTVVCRPGDYTIPGMPLVLADPPVDEAAHPPIRRAFALGPRRTPQQDAVFAFLEVADIALRALSPSINDPLTACMCLDRITSGMCLLAERSLPEAVRTGASGRGRVIAHPYSYSDIVAAAYHHIAEAARDQPMVRQRCRVCIELLLERQVAPELGTALQAELNALDRAP